MNVGELITKVNKVSDEFVNCSNCDFYNVYGNQITKYNTWLMSFAEVKSFTMNCYDNSIKVTVVDYDSLESLLDELISSGASRRTVLRTIAGLGV